MSSWRRLRADLHGGLYERTHSVRHGQPLQDRAAAVGDYQLRAGGDYQLVEPHL